ncbi:MAG: sigma 54-interacting transcriptional regulator, partial [Myxococcota bacterium]
MSQARTLQLLGPATIIYFAADSISVRAELLNSIDIVVLLAAFACSWVPFIVHGRGEARGPRYVAALGVALGFMLLAGGAHLSPSLAVEVFRVLAPILCGVLILEAALRVPDSPKPLGTIARMPLPAGMLCFAWGLAAVVPTLRLGESLWVFPAAGRWAPLCFLFASVLLGWIARFVRPHLRSPPEHLADNLWGILGLTPAAVFSLILLFTRPVSHPAPPWVRVGASVVVLALLATHVLLVDRRHRLRAAPFTRQMVAASATILCCTLGLKFVGPPIAWTAQVIALYISLVLLAGWSCYRILWSPLGRVLRPHGGRLLHEVRRFLADSSVTSGLDALGSQILPALRRASGVHRAAPLLYLAQPPRVVEIDASGGVRVRDASISPALADVFTQRPREILVTSRLAAQVVRRPDLRAVVEALLSLEAFCVLPLSIDGESIEGAVVIPRGNRSAPMSFEELHELRLLSDRLASSLSLIGARMRSELRESELRAHMSRQSGWLEATQDQVAELGLRIEILRRSSKQEAPFVWPLVAYSAVMRRLETRLEKVTRDLAPVFLHGEFGTELDSVAGRFHQVSEHCDESCIFVSCAQMQEDQITQRLFGSESETGCLRIASGGTLVLRNIGALSCSIQQELAAVLATRLLRPLHAAQAFPIDVRLVATSAVSLDKLVQSGAAHPDLARWFQSSIIEVPPLRERREDLPSLTLFALDHVCRVSGVSIRGIDSEALKVLLEHEWAGNLDELLLI